MQEILTQYMVLFIDTLLLFVDPELGTLEENEREEFILLFIKRAGLLALAECEESDDILQMNNKAYESFVQRPRSKPNYLSIAVDCLSRVENSCSQDNWHYFANSLGTVFSHEDESFVRWLVTTIKTINYSVDHFPLPELSPELQDKAVLFTLDAILNIDAERCAEHYLSQGRLNCRLH